MYKKCILFSFSLVVVLLIFFYQPIFSFFTEKLLSAYAFSQIDQPLVFEKIEWKGSKLIVTKPSLDAPFTFKSEEMALSFHFDLWKREIFIDISLKEPTWSFSRSIGNPKKTFDPFVSKDRKWIKIVPTLQIEKGALFWNLGNGLKSDHVMVDLFFSGKNGGAIVLNFESPEDSRSDLKIQASNENGRLVADCLCDKIPASSLFSFAKFLNIDFSPLQVLSGEINGSLKALFSSTHRPLIEGEVDFKDLYFKDLESSIEGHLAHVHLTLENNNLFHSHSLVGKVELLKPASILFERWKINHIVGAVELNRSGMALVNLEGIAEQSNYFSAWELSGLMNLDPRESIALVLDLSVKGKPTHIHLDIRKNKKNRRFAEIKIEKLSFEECNFAQELFRPFVANFSTIHFQEGVFNADIGVDLNRRKNGKFFVRQFDMDHLGCHFEESKVDFRCKKISGRGVARLGSQSPWEMFSGEFHLENASILSLDFRKLPFHHIQADIFIDHGQWIGSKGAFDAAKFKGTMDVDWGKNKKLIDISVVGEFYDFISLFPQPLQKSFKKANENDPFKALIQVTRPDEQLEVKGKMSVEDSRSVFSEDILFGFKVDDRGSSSSWIHSGWFYGENISTQKIISPALFRNGLLEMTGKAEIKGTFTPDSLIVQYNADHLKIESKDLCMKCDDLRSPIPGEYLGYHELNLKDLTHSGTLPIKGATYLQKRNGFLFQDIEGMTFFKNDTICLSPLEALSEGVYFRGTLDFDYSDPAPGVFSLSAECPIFSGKISQIQRLLSHLGQPSVLNEIPLEGIVVNRSKGMELKFLFEPHDFTLTADIYGAVTEGMISVEDHELSLKGIYSDVEYHHNTKELLLSDIQGAFLLGKPRKLEEYQFIGKYIRCRDLLNPSLFCDLALNDGKHELVRVVAETKENHEGSKQVEVDRTLSHLSSLYLKTWTCCLKEWSKFETFEMTSEFDLSHLLSDIQRFKNTGVSIFAPAFIEKLECAFPIAGEGSLGVNFDPLDQSCHFDLNTSYTSRNQQNKDIFSMNGKKRENKWFLDEVRWGEWSVYAEVESVENKWKIPFFGLNLPQTLLIGFEGEIDRSESLFQGTIKLGELDLSSARLKPYFDFLEFTTFPQGTLEFAGEIVWNYTECDWLKATKGHLFAESQNLAWGDVKADFKKPWELIWDEDAACQIHLKSLEGNIRYKDDLWSINEGEIQSYPSHFLFSFFHQRKSSPCEITGWVDWPSLNHGICRCSDLFSEEKGSPLMIDWERHLDGRFIFNKIKGCFSGFGMDLMQDNSGKENKLKGKIKVDTSRITSLFPDHFESIAQKIKMHSSCDFQGSFIFNHDVEKPFSDTVCFNGTVTTENIELRGFQLKTFQAHMHYEPGYLEMKNILLKDPAGTVEIDHLLAVIEKETARWTVFIPELTVKNFRFGLLRKSVSAEVESLNRFRFFSIKKLQLNDLSGSLGELDSWHGNGSMQFLNSHRKDNPLFAIPAELILRLGLDPHIMTPVTGTIFFDLQGDRFYLNRLKDVYSYARGSKFYLADHSVPSWINMEGNLSMRIRMKQYNLILKIIEPFIISIQGSLTNPNYHFEKQGKGRSGF